MKTERLPLAALVPHPLNRAVSGLDETLVAAIATTLAEAGDFLDVTRMPKARPLDGRWQIISGHHRIAAARKAGLAEATVLVEEMDDETALCEMAVSNQSSAQDPLDVGFHALALVAPEDGGRGRTGGISEMARRIGMSRQQLGQLRAAAEVLEQTRCTSSSFAGLARHLYAASTASEHAWRELVGWIEADRPTVKEVEQRVKAIKEGLDSVPAIWRDYFPERDLAPALAIGRGGVSRKAVCDLIAAMERLVAAAEDLDAEIVKAIGEAKDATVPDGPLGRRVGLEREWLLSNVGGDSWDIRQIEARRQMLVEQIEELRRNRPTVRAMSCLEYLETIPDGSVDLLLTDPPYMTDVEDIRAFAESWVPVALSKVKPGGRAYICTGSYPLELQVYADVLLGTGWHVDGPLVWAYTNTLGPAPTRDYKRNWQAIWHCYRDESPALNCPVLLEQFTVQQIAAPGTATEPRRHPWEKPEALAKRLVSHGSEPLDLVVDPFAGTGTFLVAAAALGRRADGCEIDSDMLAICSERGCEVA